MSLNDKRFLCLGGSAITRYYAEFDSVQQSHGVYANTLVFASDFSVQVDFSSTSTGLDMTFMAGEDTGNAVILDTSGGNIRALAFSGGLLQPVITTPEAPYIDGVLRSVGVSLVGTTVSLLVDGDVKSTGTWTTNPNYNISTIGTRYVNQRFFSGIIANPVATISGVTTSNTLGLATGNVEYPAENVFGANGWTGTGLTLGVGWVDNGDGTYTSDGTQSANSDVVQPLSNTSAGDLVQWQFEVISISSGGISFIASGSTQNSSSYTSVGDFNYYAEQVGVMADTKLRASSTFVGTVRVSEVRSITNAITYVNIPDSNREEFTLIDGSWINNTNVWDNTPTLGAGWTDEGAGVFSYIGDGSFSGLTESNLFSAGYSYAVSFVASGIVGDMRAIRGGLPDFVFSTNGSHSTVFAPSASTSLQFARNSGVVDCTLSTITAKRKIEIA